MQVAAVSTVVNHSLLMPYVFSNYTHPYGSSSKFPQSCKYRLWEALRASTAAPGYFEEFKLGNNIHQVGKLFLQNKGSMHLLVTIIENFFYIDLFNNWFMLSL